LLKEPLLRGIDRTGEMLAMMSAAVPRLEVDAERAAGALAGGTLATDEVMRRVEQGAPFRAAYRTVAEEARAGAAFPAPGSDELAARRKGTGNVGNLGLDQLRGRLRAARRWESAERRRFGAAIRRL